MADNKVVIKINYDRDKAIKAHIQHRTITVWHTQRIITVIALFLLLCAALFFVFSNENVEEDKPQTNMVVNAPAISEPQIPVNNTPVVNTTQTITESNTKQIPVVKRPDAVILDRHVVRALLSSAPVKDEPGEPIKLPVVIGQNQSQELFYFVQTKNIKGSILFHCWYKDGQLMSKKQFTIKANNARLISSKKLTAKDVGQWQVVLMDKKGKLLSEVNYSVNPLN